MNVEPVSDSDGDPTGIIKHQAILEELCRVCGTTIIKTGNTQTVTKNKFRLKTASLWNPFKTKYGEDIFKDKPSQHPPFICPECHRALLFRRKCGPDTPAQTCHSWPVHLNNKDCIICQKHNLQDKMEEGPQTPLSGVPAKKRKTDNASLPSDQSNALRTGEMQAASQTSNVAPNVPHNNGRLSLKDCDQCRRQPVIMPPTVDPTGPTVTSISASQIKHVQSKLNQKLTDPSKDNDQTDSQFNNRPASTYGNQPLRQPPVTPPTVDPNRPMITTISEKNIKELQSKLSQKPEEQGRIGHFIILPQMPVAPPNKVQPSEDEGVAVVAEDREGNVQAPPSPVHQLTDCSDEFLDQMLARPLDAPLTHKLEQVATHMLRTKMKQASGLTVQFKTGGQPLTALVLPFKRIEHDEASKSTHKKRQNFMDEIRRVLGVEDPPVEHTCRDCLGKDQRINKYRIQIYEDQKKYQKKMKQLTQNSKAGKESTCKNHQYIVEPPRASQAYNPFRVNLPVSSSSQVSSNTPAPATSSSSSSSSAGSGSGSGKSSQAAKANSQRTKGKAAQPASQPVPQLKITRQAETISCSVSEGPSVSEPMTAMDALRNQLGLHNYCIH